MSGQPKPAPIVLREAVRRADDLVAVRAQQVADAAEAQTLGLAMILRPRMTARLVAATADYRSAKRDAALARARYSNAVHAAATSGAWR